MIKKQDAALALEEALRAGADFAEFFFEDRHELNIRFNRDINRLSNIHVHGAGLYLIRGTCSVYAYASDTSLPSLLHLCRTAAGLLRAGITSSRPISPFMQTNVREPNPVQIYPGSVDTQRKTALLENLHRAILSTGSDVKNLDLAYFDTDQNVIIANSEGVWAEDQRVTSRIRMTPAVVGERETIGYYTDFTRPAGFEAFADGAYLDHAVQTVAEMRACLTADEAPSGYMPVVLAGGECSGTFFHEACGHQFESQTVLRGSPFTGKIGQKVASDRVTLVDDGSMPGAYGSSKFDDEGMPRQKNILIENGVMKSYLCDRLGALRLGVPRTASGRRQGYGFAPAARMSNTYLAPGPDDPDEMIRSMPIGLYVTHMGGGSSGQEFTLLAQTAYLVKNGAIDRQVKGAILLGRGDETMKKIDRVGNVLELENGGAFCGNVSGLCNTTTSGARMRIEGMLIGGKGGKLLC
ncbi:MAG TPA: TldD/PmbA family protein [Candidatus Ventrousia excrementavium]|uniref:TldD/PmbA family protein n=1 Tax=Candidatus Ventrousia excrementavium TaxID=2840961 RepID=A0A9D1IV84_9CLOT|nr:TldD/PmbA family protein [Candidatus Ventrousia excrementavium]